MIRRFFCSIGLHWHNRYMRRGYVGYLIFACRCGHERAKEL